MACMYLTCPQLKARLSDLGATTAGTARDGWTGMRTVAQLRRELGVGAPRDTNSLYKPIERAPRKFNSLKIPRTLQAQLPFKSKVMNFPGRKRDTLEQKRAIKVREPGEKRADALVHALNTIRNAKNLKRREQQTRRREVSHSLDCHNMSLAPALRRKTCHWTSVVYRSSSINCSWCVYKWNSSWGAV